MNRRLKRVLSLMLAGATLSGLMAVGTHGAAGYVDVEDGRWSESDIKYATDKGYMNGVGDERFNPEGTMERAMIVTVLYRMENEPEVKYDGHFEDVPDGEYYSAAVTWAYQNGIVNGTTETKFEPYSELTREQMAAIFARYAETKYVNTDNGADISKYDDFSDIDEYAVKPMQWSNKFGIINGDSATTLGPRKSATREQFAAILHRFELVEFKVEDYRLVYNEPVTSPEYKADYPLVKDADFYVSTSGNDSNDGSFEHPFATFERARDAVRELKKTATSEIKVAFMAGSYGSLDNIYFSAEDSGTEQVPITYCAYGDGEVLFENGKTIDGDRFVPIEESDKYLFKEEQYDNIYKVDLSGDGITSIDVLFSGGGSCYEARWPNKKEDNSDEYITNSTTTRDPYASIELQGALPMQVKRFRTFEGAKINGYLRTGWLVDCFPIKSYDEETHILTIDFDNWDPSKSNGYPLGGSGGFELMYEGRTDDRVFFSNLSDQMDTEGEYWFDPSTKVLYVYKPDGDYTIATGGQFMSLSNANYMSFVGLSFNATAGKGISTSDCFYLTIDGCKLGNVADNLAIDLWNCTGLRFINNEVYNTAKDAVCIHARDKHTRTRLESQDIVIDNNYIHNVGIVTSWSHALEINEAVGTKISHNYFSNCARGAVGWNRSIDTDIEYNVFDSLVQVAEDGGGLGSGSSVIYRSNRIRYNIFKNFRYKGAQFGIYLDDSTSGQEVYGNIFYNAGNHAITMNGGRDNMIHDNAVISVGAGDFLMYNPGAYYHVKEDGTVDDEFYSEEMYTCLKELKELDPEYEAEWRERWPLMFSYNFNPKKVGEVDCVFTTVNYIENNAIFGTKIIDDRDGFDDVYEKFAVGKETNKVYELTENPIFVDPTHGDYRIRDGADFMKIPVEEIGRRK